MSDTGPPELRSAELLAALLGRQVRFLVVGGIGAQLHGATMATRDLDVLVPWARENFDRLTAAPPWTISMRTSIYRQSLARSRCTRAANCLLACR